MQATVRGKRTWEGNVADGQWYKVPEEVGAGGQGGDVGGEKLDNGAVGVIRLINGIVQCDMRGDAGRRRVLKRRRIGLGGVLG